MRYSLEHKAQNHEKILSVAARSFREGSSAILMLRDIDYGNVDNRSESFSGLS